MAFKRTSHSLSSKFRPSHFQCYKRYFSIIGPSDADWQRWAKEFEIEHMEDEINKHRDPREVTAQELRDTLRVQGQFAIDTSIIPTLELPKDSWFSDSHIYVQQTNLDDVWRMGYSAMRFVGTRHVEWLVYDSEPKDIKLYSEAIMWFSINDWRPLKIIGQAINDIQFTMCSPFHRIQIISINEKIQNQPELIIDDEVDPNWRWVITFRWINKKEEIFSKPPIDNGRYGKWYDEEQYLEWIKDEGLYKKWQTDQVMKLAEDKKLNMMNSKLQNDFQSAKEERSSKKYEEILQGKDDRPRYLRVDDKYRGVQRKAVVNEKEKGSWKPKWFPF